MSSCGLFIFHQTVKINRKHAYSYNYNNVIIQHIIFNPNDKHNISFTYNNLNKQ